MTEDFTARLRELEVLEPDWDGYGAVPPSPAAIEAVSACVPVPHTDGGVQIECHSGGVEFEVTFDESGHVSSILIETPDATMSWTPASSWVQEDQ